MHRRSLAAAGAAHEAAVAGAAAFSGGESGVSIKGRTRVSGHFFASACRQALDERHLINVN
jgi:hypothetical protein